MSVKSNEEKLNQLKQDLANAYALIGENEVRIKILKFLGERLHGDAAKVGAKLDELMKEIQSEKSQPE